MTCLCYVCVALGVLLAYDNGLFQSLWSKARAFLNCTYRPTNCSLILHYKKTHLKSITVNWKISTGTWPNPNEQLDDARTDTGRTAPSLLFFFTLYKFCWQFNQFCRVVTAQAGSPRRRAPCRCCEQSCLSLQQLHSHRDHALPPRCRLAQCTALRPWEVSVQPPASCLQRAGKGLGKRLHAGTRRVGRICFQDPLAASSQASNPACTTQHNHCKAVGIKHHS